MKPCYNQGLAILQRGLLILYKHIYQIPFQSSCLYKVTILKAVHFNRPRHYKNITNLEIIIWIKAPIGVHTVISRPEHQGQGWKLIFVASPSPADVTRLLEPISVSRLWIWCAVSIFVFFIWLVGASSVSNGPLCTADTSNSKK